MNWAERIKAAQKRGHFLDYDKRKASRPDLRGIVALGSLPDGAQGLRAESLGFALADAIASNRPATAAILEKRLSAVVRPGGVL